MPSDHRLAALKAISPGDLAGETFVIVSHTAPVLRTVIANYLKRSGINITPVQEADHVTMGMVDVRRGAVTCLRTELSPFVCNESPSEGRCANCRSGPRLQKVEPVSRPKAFAFELDELVARASNKTR